MNTTLNNIRRHNPCEDSWRKLLASLNKTQADDEALPMRHILDTLGIQDAIWSLRSFNRAKRETRLFACDCAERVLPIYESRHPYDDAPRTAIEVARRYANGEATSEELRAAADAVAASAADAVGRAAADAADAAWAAAYAAVDAAWAAAYAAVDVSRAVAYAAADAADAAAWDAAADAAAAASKTEREAQTELFIKYFCQ